MRAFAALSRSESALLCPTMSELSSTNEHLVVLEPQCEARHSCQSQPLNVCCMQLGAPSTSRGSLPIARCCNALVSVMSCDGQRLAVAVEDLVPKADGSTVQAALAAIADRTSAGKGEFWAPAVVQHSLLLLAFTATEATSESRFNMLTCSCC